jgi:phage-related protein
MQFDFGAAWIRCNSVVDEVIIYDNLVFMSWTITFFNEKVEEEALVFPAGVLANLIHILEVIEEFGPALGKPHTAPMGHGLFEIRAKSREGIGRALFCTLKGEEIVILHAFIKKTPKTPKRDLEKARGRLKELR